MHLRFAQAIIGTGILAKSHDMLDACLFSQFFKLFETLVITIEKRVTARHNTFKNLSFRDCDFFKIGKMPEMRRCNQCDQRHMRTHHLPQRTNFVVMIHADLEHTIIGIGRHTGERQRHTPMIVERSNRSVNFA